MRFDGKVAVVAGAGGGIGLCVAMALIDRGARVVLADVKAMPEEVGAAGAAACYVRGDLRDEAFVAAVAERAAANHARIDLLVNATGVLRFGQDRSFLDMDMAVWDEVLAVNLKSFALTARHVIPHMQRAGGGAMVHFSSIDALAGDAAPQDAYGASKAAVIRLSKSIAVQFAKDEIRSNAILPGPVLSPMQERWAGRADLQAAAAASIPLGRLGSVTDMANACLFLLSDQAGFITGTELVVDGGITAGR